VGGRGCDPTPRDLAPQEDRPSLVGQSVGRPEDDNADRGVAPGRRVDSVDGECHLGAGL
jgi:hypothetical protein